MSFLLCSSNGAHTDSLDARNTIPREVTFVQSQSSSESEAAFEFVSSYSTWIRRIAMAFVMASLIEPGCVSAGGGDKGFAVIDAP